MAYPTFTVVNTAVNAIYDLFAANKPGAYGRSVIASLSRITSRITQVYAPLVDFTIVDTTDATMTIFLSSTGSLSVALGRVARVGDVFQVGGTGDTTNNALEAAKGSACADNDIFVVSNVSTPACVYLGNTSAPLLFTDNEIEDFKSIGA